MMILSWTSMSAILLISSMPYSMQMTTTSYCVSASTQQMCPCVGVDYDEECILDEMFSTLHFWEGNENKCVSDAMKISISPWMSPSPLTRDYIQPIDTCDQTYELPALSVISANPCGPTVCCVECMTCFDNMYDIFNEAGPTILKDNLTNMMHPSYGPPLLYITCYLDDFVPTVGEQYVLINFEYSNDCVSNGIASTAMATESSPPPSTNHGMQTSHVVAPSSSESSLSPSTTHDMQTNHAVASSSTGVSDSVALALVLTFTGLAALIVTCIGLNYVVAKTKRPTGQSV